MATYKKIIDVETVAEASEATNVLVEEAGSLKKIPSSKIGGGSSKTIIFKFHDNWNIEPNVTYEEFEELYNNGDIETMMVKSYNAEEDSYSFYYNSSVYRMPEGGFCFSFRNWDLEMCFYPDGSLEAGGNA